MPHVFRRAQELGMLIPQRGQGSFREELKLEQKKAGFHQGEDRAGIHSLAILAGYLLGFLLSGRHWSIDGKWQSCQLGNAGSVLEADESQA